MSPVIRLLPSHTMCVQVDIIGTEREKVDDISATGNNVEETEQSKAEANTICFLPPRP